MTLPFEVGDNVRCRNQIWEVIRIEDHNDGSWTVKLFPEDESRPRSFLYPLTPIEPIKSAVDNLQAGRLDHIDNYRLYTSATRLSLVYEYDKLLSISNSKMVPEPYQLLAVKKVMESLRQRFLIADDVGLGKTIEAGLIMQELTARQRGTRVLIVVPASLQDQWKKEMLRHFHRKFYLYNSRKIEGIKELVDENLNPWLAKNSIITSIDWIKPQYEGTGASRRNVNRVFEQLVSVEKPWDLIIIDEAHYASTDSNRADLAKALQDRCESLILTTATPHSGNPQHFFNLLNLIDPFMFVDPEDLDRSDARQRVDKVMIRRGKETIYELNRDNRLVKKFRDREPRPVEIDFSQEEMALYEAVSEYTATGWAQLNRRRKISASDRNIGKFLLTLVQKRMVSSLYALRETLKRRVESIVETRTTDRIEGVNTRDIKRMLKDYTSNSYMEDDDRELVERYLETRKVQEMYAERTNEVKTLREFLDKADDLIQAGTDSKLTWLMNFLKELTNKDPNEKVIIFTEYRDTLEYIKARLESDWRFGPGSVVTIHGGMPLGEDDSEEGSKLYAERRFNDPDTRILLATDAASEGLNLQKHCHILVNYELPWNPNRLEQRIGRIHRYGQKRTALIYNLMIKDSKEAEIFKRLTEKIEIIRNQLGSMAEVLGILEQVSLDDMILKVLDRSVPAEEASDIAERELQRMQQIADELKEMQFLSGCRQFTREDIQAADQTITESQQAIPTHNDVQRFVETFLNVFGESGRGDRNGRKLQATRHKGVYRLLVPSVIQDDKLPRQYDRITFDRKIAMKDWERHQEPDFVAFGHPLLERMVYYCRVVRSAELSGKLSCLVTDYIGLPGVVFNYLLRFEDQEGRIVREELEPVFVDQEGKVHPDLGHKLYLAASVPQASPNEGTLAKVQTRIEDLKQAAGNYVRSQYTDYYERVEQLREQEIQVLLADLERFNKGMEDQFRLRKVDIEGEQLSLGGEFESTSVKGLRTRLENQMRMHHHRMEERRHEVENMRLGAFPAPELLNMVIVTPIQ
jgi:ERCC4-related helicase